jgi:hypothetical protein
LIEKASVNHFAELYYSIEFPGRDTIVSKECINRSCVEIVCFWGLGAENRLRKARKLAEKLNRKDAEALRGRKGFMGNAGEL